MQNFIMISLVFKTFCIYDVTIFDPLRYSMIKKNNKKCWAGKVYACQDVSYFYTKIHQK